MSQGRELAYYKEKGKKMRKSIFAIIQPRKKTHFKSRHKKFYFYSSRNTKCIFPTFLISGESG